MYKIFILISIIFLGCTKTITEKERKDIFAFKEMSNLTTIEYTLSKVVKANDTATWFKIGDRKILMSVTAYVKAGIDLSQVKEDNVTKNNNTILITLPSAKIISLNIPPNEIRQEMTDIDVFRNNFTNEEKNALLTQAEIRIRQTIDSIGIVQKAQDNAKVFIENFVKRLGYDNVEINFTK